MYCSLRICSFPFDNSPSVLEFHYFFLPLMSLFWCDTFRGSKHWLQELHILCIGCIVCVCFGYYRTSIRHLRVVSFSFRMTTSLLQSHTKLKDTPFYLLGFIIDLYLLILRASWRCNWVLTIVLVKIYFQDTIVP